MSNQVIKLASVNQQHQQHRGRLHSQRDHLACQQAFLTGTAAESIPSEVAASSSWQLGSRLDKMPTGKFITFLLTFTTIAAALARSPHILLLASKAEHACSCQTNSLLVDPVLVASVGRQSVNNQEPGQWL